MKWLLVLTLCASFSALAQDYGYEGEPQFDESIYPQYENEYEDNYYQEPSTSTYEDQPYYDEDSVDGDYFQNEGNEEEYPEFPNQIADESQQPPVKMESSIFSPQQAILEAMTAPLKFKKKLLMQGSISVKSCLFENDKVVVVYGNCTKKESPSTNIRILSKNGGLVTFSIENSAATEARGPISTQTRANYDGTWRVDYKSTSPLAAGASAEDIDAIVSNINGSCSTGGTMASSARTFCFNEARDLEYDWKNVAVDFWNEPGQDWYEFLKAMRVQVSALPQ